MIAMTKSTEPILERVLTDLIAKELGVRPAEITSEFIQTWREQKLYNHAQYGENSKYGGYNIPRRLRIVSNEELAKRAERVETFLKGNRSGRPIADNS